MEQMFWLKFLTANIISIWKKLYKINNNFKIKLCDRIYKKFNNSQKRILSQNNKQILLEKVKMKNNV